MHCFLVLQENKYNIIVARQDKINIIKASKILDFKIVC